MYQGCKNKWISLGTLLPDLYSLVKNISLANVQQLCKVSFPVAPNLQEGRKRRSQQKWNPVKRLMQVEQCECRTHLPPRKMLWPKSNQKCAVCYVCDVTICHEEPPHQTISRDMPWWSAEALSKMIGQSPLRSQ